MKISEVLDAAATLIEPPGAWMQNNYAHDAEGYFTDPRGEDAKCFCGLGAIARVDGINVCALECFDDCDSIMYVENHTDLNLVEFNDDPRTSQAMMVAKLREIASQARAEGK